MIPAIQVAQTRQGRVAYTLSGSGPTNIVLLNGSGVSLEGWSRLYPAIEALGRVFACDRLGLKASDAPSQPQTGAAVVACVREVLGYAGMTPPYVLVGHSLGGLFAQLHARLHPTEVAGLLLLDATHPAERDVLLSHADSVAKSLARLLGVPQPMLEANLQAELAGLDETLQQLAGAGPFPDIPLTVVTGGQVPPVALMSPAAAGARRALQQELARLSPQGEQWIAQASGHFPQVTQPGLVLQAVERLLAAAAARAAVQGRIRKAG